MNTCFYIFPTTPLRYIYAHNSMLCPLNITKTDGKCWSDGMGRWAAKFGSDAVRVQCTYIVAYCMSEWAYCWSFFSVSMCTTFNTLRCLIINILLSLYHASDIKRRWPMKWLQTWKSIRQCPFFYSYHKQKLMCEHTCQHWIPLKWQSTVERISRCRRSACNGNSFNRFICRATLIEAVSYDILSCPKYETKFRNATQYFWFLDLSYAHNFNLFIINVNIFYSFHAVQCAQIGSELLQLRLNCVCVCRELL